MPQANEKKMSGMDSDAIVKPHGASQGSNWDLLPGNSFIINWVGMIICKVARNKRESRVYLGQKLMPEQKLVACFSKSYHGVS